MSAAAEPTFLLFGGSNDRAVCALARVMSACEVRFAAIARNPDDRLFDSAYRRKVVAVRSSDSLDARMFEHDLKAVRAAAAADRCVIVPSSEFLNLFLLGLDRERLAREAGCVVPLVDRELYARLTHKESSARWFGAAGFRVPATLDGFTAAALPLVAKPRRNLGPDGLIQYPVLIESRAALDAFLAQGLGEHYFAQEYVQGESRYLLAYISRDGEVFASSQLNLAQQPGGKSIVLAETSDFHDTPVARKTLELLLGARFHGFVMVEFIADARGPCFIEVNPRPWGPLQLCADHACGIIEAFLGDFAHQDPWRYRGVWIAKPPRARYLWAGGMIETLKAGQRPRWYLPPGRRLSTLARSLSSDVYLRRDTLRVFLSEALTR